MMFAFRSTFSLYLLGSAAASQPFLHTYGPKTPVTDAAGISFDQQVLEAKLTPDREDSFALAEEIYERGGNSMPIAEILLESPGLPFDINKGALFTGVGVDGKTVEGKSSVAYSQGDRNIMIQYEFTEDPIDYVKCKVGGLPADEQMTSGCFSEASDATIQLEGSGTPLGYTYNIATDNTNGRTISGFSTNAKTFMQPLDESGKLYFDEFQKFVDYYGTYDYGDKIVKAGLDGTSVALNGKNFDFTQANFDARAEIVKKGAAYMLLGQAIVRNLEAAILHCDECLSDGCIVPLNTLDVAVAFYVGANHGQDAQGLGNLYFALPEKRCVNFGTCSEGLTGQSNVNTQIFQQLGGMQDKLSTGQCSASEPHVAEIIRLMYIPLIQGTLRYAYIVANDNAPSEKAMAEGYIFAAAVLPAIAKCNPDAADTIYQNMKFGEIPDFAAVKTAFESTYSCLKIPCEAVGGLVNGEKTGYYPGAGPCGDGANLFNDNSSASYFSVGLAFAASAVAGFALLL